MSTDDLLAKVKRVEATEIRDGDVLFVTVPDATHEECLLVRDHLSTLLKGLSVNARAIVMTRGTTVEVKRPCGPPAEKESEAV